MHLYILTRGQKKEVDDMITQLQGKYLPMKFRTEQDPELKDYALQVGVRPVQLWEIAFPEEHLDLMCQTLFTNEKQKDRPQHKWQEKFIWAIRKALKLGKIPDFKHGEGMPLGGIQHVEVVGVGIKKDYYINSKNEHVKKRTPDCYEGI